jgi:hypothetical protein
MKRLPIILKVSFLFGLLTGCVIVSADNLPTYEPTRIVVGVDGFDFGNARVNEKGQVVSVHNTGSPPSIWRYLPAPDYGLAAGVHREPIDEGMLDIDMYGLNNNADIIGVYSPVAGGRVPFATYNHEIIELGDLVPVSLSDEGIVYGYRGTTWLQPYDPDRDHSVIWVAFDLATQRELFAIDYTPERVNPAIRPIYPSRLSWMEILAANSEGDFAARRTDKLSVQDYNDKLIYPTSWDGYSLQLVRRGAQPLSLPELPDLATIIPDTVWRSIPNQSVWRPPEETLQDADIFSLNDKGQVFGFRDRCDGCDFQGPWEPLYFIYLPLPDYGLSAGLHYLEPGFGGNPWYHPYAEMTANGDAWIENLARDTTIWHRGHVFDPSDRLASGAAFDATRIFDINDNGDILIAGFLDGGPQRVYLLKSNQAIQAQISVRDTDVGLDEAFAMSLTIRNTSDQPFILSGAFADTFQIDRTSTEGLILVDRTPDNTNLAPGESWTQTFTYKATVDQEIIFRAQAIGVFADGTENLTPTLTSETVKVRGDPPVAVRLRALPLFEGKPIVDLELDEEGILRNSNEEPVDLKVEVEVENVSPLPVTAVLQGVDPRARDRTPLSARVRTDFPEPLDIGTLQPGEVHREEVSVEVAEDGRFAFKALVSATRSDQTRARNVSVEGAPIAVNEPYPVLIELKLDPQGSDHQWERNGSFLVDRGGKLRVIATVTNQTTNATLTFTGIHAEKSLNAFKGVLTTPEGHQVPPSMAHGHEKGPGEFVVLTGEIETDPRGAPKGVVVWQLPQDATLVDDATGDERQLRDDDFLVESELGSWLGDPLAVRLVQDNSQPPPREIDALETFAHFSIGAQLAVARWMDDNISAVGSLLSLATDPTRLANAMGEGSRALWEATEMAHLGWSSMTDDEKTEMVVQVTGEVFRRGALLLEAPFQLENYPAALEYTREATFFLFSNLEDAYASNDPARIAEAWGSVSGNLGMEVASSFLPTPQFKRYAEAAELLKLQKAADNIRNPLSRQQELLRTLESGPLTRKDAMDAWGIGGKQLDDVQEVMDALGMKGYARERAPRSLDLSEVRDEAVLKPPDMQPKGFNDLDALVLGKDLPVIRGKTGEDLGPDAVTMLIWPPPLPSIRARLAGESPELIEAVIARARQRQAEYKKHYPDFRKYAKDPNDGGGIPIEFNYKDNDTIANAPPEPDGAVRAFEFETQDLQSGARIQIPRMANKAGEKRLITGDIDWIHFSWLDGTPLDPATAGKLYEILAICCGLQHGETISWIKKGQAIFEKKANQIGDYIRGEKALLEVSGEGIKAVRINPKLTFFSLDDRNHLIFFDNGLKSLKGAIEQVALEQRFRRLFDSLPPRRVVLPLMWYARSGDFAADNTVDGVPYRYGKGDDAYLAQQVADGSLEFFDGIDWVPLELGETGASRSQNVFSRSMTGSEPIPRDTPTELVFVPTTLTLEPASPGDRNLVLLDIPNGWGDILGDSLATWFEVGDNIILAPGTARQEVRQIIQLDPFTLDRPLDQSHPADTLVAVLNSVVADGIPTVTTPARQDSGNTITDEFLALTFDLPFGERYRFETSSDLTLWSPVPADLFEGGTYFDNSIASDYPNEPVEVLIPLPDQSQEVPNQFLRWMRVD